MKIFSEEQKEQLREISAKLRHIREEKSIDIQEIAAQTHIRPFLLKALESGQYEDLPEPVFVKGFIRRYAEALGLNGTNFADGLQVNYLPINFPQQDINPPKKQPVAYIPLVAPYILLLFAASLGIFYLLFSQSREKFLAQKSSFLSITERKKLSSSPNHSPSPINTINLTPTPLSIAQETKPSPPTSIASSSAISNSNSTPTPSPENTNNPDDLKVNLELQNESWLHIKSDGKTIFAGILTKGKRKDLKAQKSVIVRSGNAGAVLVSVNNQPPKVLGENGEVKEVKYSND